MDYEFPITDPPVVAKSHAMTRAAYRRRVQGHRIRWVIDHEPMTPEQFWTACPFGGLMLRLAREANRPCVIRMSRVWGEPAVNHIWLRLENEPDALDNLTAEEDLALAEALRRHIPGWPPGHHASQIDREARAAAGGTP